MIVGASGSAIGLSVLYLLTDLAGWYYLFSYVVAFALSVSNNYLWNSLWTFNGKKAHIKGYGKYVILNLATLGLNLVMVYIFTEIVGLWYMLSAVVVTAIVFLINFAVSHKYVWNRDAIS